MSQDILVIDMNPREVECSLCGDWCEHRWSVPTYNGDLVSNDFPDEMWHTGGGGQAVCLECYEKHARGELMVFDRFYVRPGFVGGDGI